MSKKTKVRDFPGGSVVKTLPANAGVIGSVPGQGRYHMPRSNEAHVPQLLSQSSRAHEPYLLKPVLHNKRSHHNEKLAHHNRVASSCCNQRKPTQSNEDPAEPKINK